jgi:hypothetical protein
MDSFVVFATFCSIQIMILFFIKSPVSVWLAETDLEQKFAKETKKASRDGKSGREHMEQQKRLAAPDSSPAGRSGRLRDTALVSASQLASVGLGAAWGIGLSHRVEWLPGPSALCGGFAVLSFGCDGAHYLLSARGRAGHRVSAFLCIALGVYAVILMAGEAFLFYSGNESFITGVLLLLPFLLALSPLVRARAWLGVVGVIVFIATSLAMLIRNGMSIWRGTGFVEGCVF